MTKDKFQKILDFALDHSVPFEAYDPNAELSISGYPVGDILDSPALQDKLYDLYFPPSHTAKGIRTMSIEDIRSR